MITKFSNVWTNAIQNKIPLHFGLTKHLTEKPFWQQCDVILFAQKWRILLFKFRITFRIVRQTSFTSNKWLYNVHTYTVLRSICIDNFHNDACGYFCQQVVIPYFILINLPTFWFVTCGEFCLYMNWCSQVKLPMKTDSIVSSSFDMLIWSGKSENSFVILC